LPKGQKRTLESDQSHSPTQHRQKRQRPVELRKRPREEHLEPAEQARKRRRPLLSDCKTANPKFTVHTHPSHGSDITEWALGVARDTANNEPKDQPDYNHLSNMHMQRLLAERKSVQRKRASSSIASSLQSDQEYQDASYVANLEANGSFMKEYRGELPDDAKKFNSELCRMLLEKEQPVPRDSLFSDNSFEETMEMIQDRNEAMIIKTISALMFPHVQAMAIRGAKHLKPFIQSFDEGWNNCIKITQTRPQPDSAIGFGTSELSAEQLEKLRPYLGDLNAKSYFRATFFMLFPFITFEVKRGSIGLDIADRQNAHSNTVAVLGLAEFFRLCGREQELHGRLLTFSISIDHRMARLYGYLPIIEGQNITCWRREIEAFDFKTCHGRDRWKCLTFALNVVEVYGLWLLERIRSALDSWTPDSELEASQRSETPSSRPLGLSQIFNEQDLSDGNESISGQVKNTDLQPITPQSSTKPSSPRSSRPGLVASAA
jgi:hypothetical protein